MNKSVLSRIHIASIMNKSASTPAFKTQRVQQKECNKHSFFSLYSDIEQIKRLLTKHCDAYEYVDMIKSLLSL